MGKQVSPSHGTGWKLLVPSGFAAVVVLVFFVFVPELLVLFIAIVFVVSMIVFVLDMVGAKRHGDEWADWRTDPVEPIQNRDSKRERTPLFSEVADPKNFPRKLPTAWKRRTSLKERNKVVTDRKGLPGDY